MALDLPDLDEVRALCDAVSKPYNFMVDIPWKSFTFVGTCWISLAAPGLLGSH
jgi:hypothetical protein